MDRQEQKLYLERIQSVLSEVEESLSHGKKPDLAGYFIRFPELEEELRGQFRRKGLLSDPFRDAGQFRRELPPWEAGSSAGEKPPAPPVSTSPPRPKKPGFLLENLVRPAVQGDRRPLLRRRSLTILFLVLAFVGGWTALSIWEEVAARAFMKPSLRARVDGLASLASLAVQWPDAREDLFRQGLEEADRLIRAEGDRWELRWFRFLFLQGLGRAKEAARDLDALPADIGRQLLLLERPGILARLASPGDIPALAALGEALEKGPDRAREIIPEKETGDGRAILAIARGTLHPSRRAEASRILLGVSEPHTRLLGAAWGVLSGDPSARSVLRSLPIDSLAAARVLVELGEEELFLERANPGRIDLAPLRMRILEKQGKRSEARLLAEGLLAKDPESFEIQLEFARLLRKEKDFAGASRHLRAATLLRPSALDPMREWLLVASECPARPDLIAPCADLFLRRISEEVRAVRAREGLEFKVAEGGGEGGTASDGGGETGGAERLLVNCGFALPKEAGDSSGAIGALRKAASARPRDGAILFLLGRALFAAGDWSGAAERFEAAMRAADPSDRQAISPWRSASLRRAKGTLGAAAPDVPRQAEVGPEARVRAAWALLGLGSIEEARSILGDASADGGIEGHLTGASIEAARGDLEAPDAWLMEAILRAPEDPRPWFLRGYFRSLRGEDSLAQGDWDEVLRLSRSGSALHSGIRVREEGEEPEARGVSLEPEALSWELAIIHAARGDLAEARDYAFLGPARGLTPLGSFFRAAALAAVSEQDEAEAEARHYRMRGFPIFSFQTLDPWAGSLFQAPLPLSPKATSENR